MVQQTTRKPAPSERQKVSLVEDLRSGEIKHSLQRDFREISDFYLDTNTRDRLSSMGRVKKTFVVSIEVLKSMFLKLTPARRLMLILAIFLAVNGLGESTGQVLSGFVILTFILILELKDKLLAQDELAAGRVVQNALMPEESPHVEGWDTWIYTRPANDVGGDLVDYLDLDDGRVGIAIGDVAGKGLPAALLMAKLQATVRAVATEYDSLADLGLRVNAIFRRDGIPSRFASLAFLTLRSDANRIKLLNAGHLPPLICREDGVSELPHSSPALGIMESPVFEEQEVELQPGECLVVFSDGVSEARDEFGTFFGTTRLIKLLPLLRHHTARELGERLVRRVEEFVGDEVWSDDLSIVVIRRAGHVVGDGPV